MVRIAVYGSGSSDKEQIRIYAESVNASGKVICRVAFYDNYDELAWDMEELGCYDVVVIYRDWTVAKLIRSRYDTVNVVMVADGTHNDVYDVQPCYLLYEPYDEEAFAKVMTSAMRSSDGEDMFAFCANRINYRLRVGEIMYFENDRRKIKIVCKEHTYTFYGNMSDLEARMRSTHTEFIRVHSSYLINISYIREFYANRVVMSNGMVIVISAGRRSDVREKYIAYLSSLNMLENHINFSNSMFRRPLRVTLPAAANSYFPKPLAEKTSPDLS